MKTALLKKIIVLSLILWLSGCMTLPNRDRLVATEDQSNITGTSEIQVNYPVKDDLDVTVKFENQQTCDAVQLGLFMVASIEGTEEIPDYVDSVFFPRYFAMINSDISDGLLFISEKEAIMFARAAYLQYRKTVTDLDYLQYIREPRILKDIMLMPKDETDEPDH